MRTPFACITVSQSKNDWYLWTLLTSKNANIAELLLRLLLSYFSDPPAENRDCGIKSLKEETDVSEFEKSLVLDLQLSLFDLQTNKKL